MKQPKFKYDDIVLLPNKKCMKIQKITKVDYSNGYHDTYNYNDSWVEESLEKVEPNFNIDERYMLNSGFLIPLSSSTDKLNITQLEEEIIDYLNSCSTWIANYDDKTKLSMARAIIGRIVDNYFN